MTISQFRPVATRISKPLAMSAVTRRCDCPDDPIDLRAAWRKRLADHQAKIERRRQRVDWYLNHRAARS